MMSDKGMDVCVMRI